MRGFELKDFSEALRVGLRRFPSAINSKGLIECLNLVPAEGGLELYEPLIDLNASGALGTAYALVYADTEAFVYVDTDDFVYEHTIVE